MSKRNIEKVYIDKYWFQFTAVLSNPKDAQIERANFGGNQFSVGTFLHYLKDDEGKKQAVWFINLWTESGWGINKNIAKLRIFDKTLSDVNASSDGFDAIKDIKNRKIKVDGDLNDPVKISFTYLFTEKEGLGALNEIPYKKGGFDPMIEYYDLKCPCGTWASVPEFGRVIEISAEEFLKAKENNIEAFVYKEKFYKTVPSSEWRLLTWWNVSEYNELRANYPSWPDFDDVWSGNVKDSETETGWRDNNGKVSHFKRTPVIGSYERVVSRGWHVTPNPETIECPCCRTLYKVYSETNSWISKKEKLNLFWKDVKDSLRYIKYKHKCR